MIKNKWYNRKIIAKIIGKIIVRVEIIGKIIEKIIVRVKIIGKIIGKISVIIGKIIGNKAYKTHIITYYFLLFYLK